MSATHCLLCGRNRIETACGDQSCPCSGGKPFSSLRPVIVSGVVYGDHMMQPCGKMTPVKHAQHQKGGE